MQDIEVDIRDVEDGTQVHFQGTYFFAQPGDVIITLPGGEVALKRSQAQKLGLVEEIEPEKAPEELPDEDSVTLDDMNKAALLELAAEMGLTTPSRATNAELIELIQGAAG